MKDLHSKEGGIFVNRPFYFYVTREMGNLFPVKRDLPASRETWIGRLFFREAWYG